MFNTNQLATLCKMARLSIEVIEEALNRNPSLADKTYLDIEKTKYQEVLNMVRGFNGES